MDRVERDHHVFHAGVEPVQLVVQAVDRFQLVAQGRLQPALSLRSKTLDRHANLAAAHSLYLMRQAMLLLKTVGGLCWGADPKVRRALGLRDYPSDPGTWKQA